MTSDPTPDSPAGCEIHPATPATHLLTVGERRHYICFDCTELIAIFRWHWDTSGSLPRDELLDDPDDPAWLIVQEPDPGDPDRTPKLVSGYQITGLTPDAEEPDPVVYGAAYAESPYRSTDTAPGSNAGTTPCSQS